MGSYNYLGFAENDGRCSETVRQAIQKHGIATCSTRHELGMILSEGFIYCLIRVLLRNKKKDRVLVLEKRTLSVSVY